MYSKNSNKMYSLNQHYIFFVISISSHFLPFLVELAVKDPLL